MRAFLSGLTIIALVVAWVASATMVLLLTQAAAKYQPRALYEQDQGQNAPHQTIPWL